MVHTLLQALLPVIFVIALGWAAAHFGWIKADVAGTFSGFVIRFALPFALFLGVVKSKPEDLTNVPFLLTLTAGLFGTLLLGLLVGAKVFKLSLRDASVFALGGSFPNMAYFGLPVLTAAVGPTGVLAIAVGNLIVTVLVLPLTIVLIETHGKQEATAGDGPEKKRAGALLVSSVASACAQPVVWLPVIGLVLTLLGVKLPGPVLESFDEVGKASGGLALFTLGLMIAVQRLGFNWQIAVALVLKNFVQAGIMFGAGLLLGLRWPFMAEVVLIGTMPSATAVAMFAQRYDAFRENAPGLIFLSTLLSIFTVAAALALIPRLPH